MTILSFFGLEAAEGAMEGLVLGHQAAVEAGKESQGVAIGDALSELAVRRARGVRNGVKS